MFSRRTGVLLLVWVVLTLVVGVIAHRRQELCHEVPHGFARRAPIAGASGTNTFVCSEIYKGLPLGEKVLAVGWAFGVLALVRSVLIDRRVRRELQARDWGEE